MFYTFGMDQIFIDETGNTIFNMSSMDETEKDERSVF